MAAVAKRQGSSLPVVKLHSAAPVDDLIHQGQTYRFATGVWGHINFSYKALILKEPCVYCGRQADGRDHILASSKGGKNNWTNRAQACSACDRSKGNKSLLLFLVTDKPRRERAAGAMNRLRKRAKACAAVSLTLPAPVVVERKTFVVTVLEAVSIALRAADAFVTRLLVKARKQSN